MADDIVVQRVGPSDSAELARAFKVLNSESELDPHLDTHTEHLTRALAAPNSYVFLALKNGAPVGYVTAYRFPRFDHPSDQMYLFGIEVIPAARRLGVGRRLTQALLSACWEDGVTWAWAGTARENVAAQRLLAAAGGQRVGETYVEYHFTPCRD